MRMENNMNEATFVADWKIDNGRKYTIKVGKGYNGVSHCNKLVLGLICDNDDVLVVFRSKKGYGCETLRNFCYQIHLRNEADKAERMEKRREAKMRTAAEIVLV